MRLKSRTTLIGFMLVFVGGSFFVPSLISGGSQTVLIICGLSVVIGVIVMIAGAKDDLDRLKEETREINRTAQEKNREMEELRRDVDVLREQYQQYSHRGDFFCNDCKTPFFLTNEQKEMESSWDWECPKCHDRELLYISKKTAKLFCYQCKYTFEPISMRISEWVCPLCDESADLVESN